MYGNSDQTMVNGMHGEGMPEKREIREMVNRRSAGALLFLKCLVNDYRADRSPCLLPDAEFIENPFEDILRIGCSDNETKTVKGSPQIHGREFG